MTLTTPSVHAELLSLHTSESVRAAAAKLVQAVRREGRNRSLSAEAYASTLETLGDMRGLPMVLPLLTAGAGEGASVQLADGRRVLDMVSGIGPYVFGHDDQDLLEIAAIAAAADVAFQSHVLPGPEYYRLSRTLLRHTGDRLEHVWLSLSGSMANENAWKMILQHHAPRDHVLAFDHAFHGRTIAMSELTDRPEYRDGLPMRDNVHRVPFYDPSDPHSTHKSVDAIDRALARNPNRIAAMCFELIQGEGGFNDAPPEYFRALMERCRSAGLGIWVDEIQTFGRTRDLFAFKTLGLGDLVDVVTIGKILHGSAALFTQTYRPKPKLVAGTWAGSTVGMAMGARILERLESEGYLGLGGRIDLLGKAIDDAFEALNTRLPNVVTARSGIGAMQGFVAWQGDGEVTTELVRVCLEEGVLLQTAGSSPMKIRLLPPLCLTTTELEGAFAALERGLGRIADRFGLPIDTL